eukprot:TRINITY_DN18101_c0_g1_i1.p1 TRINITY_DN18101_c0_g1~~TRINITY_DN18101_c0_g1_i1.p1  ORF type:complete len:261 (-),score=10.59 TRINITY_DN18101_c0_g1_i1:479-1183(-)
MTALEGMRLEATCQGVCMAVQSGWASDMERFSHRLGLRSQSIPAWRKALPCVSFTKMRSMSYLPHFARARTQLADMRSPCRSAIVDAINISISEDPKLLMTFLRAPGQALIIALPPLRESSGRTFHLESIGRASTSLPLYVQVADKCDGRSRSKQRHVTVAVFGHTRSLWGKRLCVTCVPASPHLWSDKRQQIDNAERLPFVFPFTCRYVSQEHQDLARLIVVFVSISRSTSTI